MRFTLSKLFLAVTMAALGCAGMLSPSHGMASAVLTLTIAVFVVTAIRAIGFHGRNRVFAVTFSVVGGVYLFLMTNYFTRPIARALATNYPLSLFAIAQDRAPSNFNMSPTAPVYYAPAAPAATSPATSPPITSSGIGQSSSTSPPVYAAAPAPVPISSILPSATVSPYISAAAATSPAPSMTVEMVILMGQSDDDERWPLVRLFLGERKRWLEPIMFCAVLKVPDNFSSSPVQFNSPTVRVF